LKRLRFKVVWWELSKRTFIRRGDNSGSLLTIPVTLPFHVTRLKDPSHFLASLGRRFPYTDVFPMHEVDDSYIIVPHI
jgi:hypothetical protein